MRRKITTTDLDFEDLHRFLYENKAIYGSETNIRWAITSFVIKSSKLKDLYLDLSISSDVVAILDSIDAITRSGLKSIEINEPKY
jgi:hypothetical protein